MLEEDLAERVDALFCEISGGGIGPYQDMDTISMLLTGWVIFILISVALVKYLYFRFVKKTSFNEFESSSDTDSRTNLLLHDEQEQINGACGSRTVESISGLKTIPGNKPQAPARRRHRVRSTDVDVDTDHHLSTTCTGPDPAVAEFINQVHDWAFNNKTSGPWTGDIKQIFVTSLNQVLKDEGLKSDLTISITDLSFKNNLKLYNMFAECIHPDTVKVTSDCEMQLNGVVSLIPKLSPSDANATTTSTAVAIPKLLPFFVDRICGRLSFFLNTEEHTAIVKLDGWPEICVSVSSDHESAQAMGDAVASAIRNCLAELNYGNFPQFPPAPKFTPKKEQVKYLLLTVVRGRELGLLKGCQEAYCAIELDDPPQKFQTDIVRSHDPVWNENFVFNILPNGGELLFEVHDKVGARFLGCNIISVDEIKTGGRMETLKLKSRKMEDSDGYSGSVDVQFTPLSEAEYLQRSKNKGMTTTWAVFTRSPDSKSSAAFTDNVIKELGRNVLSPNAKKSTLIIHAVQRERRSDDPADAVTITQYGDDRGRRKTRKGDIFTSIRRRFSKGRSHSVMGGENKEAVPQGEDGVGDNILQRSISADRQSMASTATRLGLGSARSSTSELSGISGFSTTTFVHENSTLVIECVENRVKKYFLVPPNLAESGRYRKKGKKLHIYNDHTFLAKHLPSGTMCEICTMRLPFSIGKQGYQCRDCNMHCHKECHVRAPSFCPKTTIYDIELSSVRQLEIKRKPSSSVGLFSSLFGSNKVSSGGGGVTNKSGGSSSGGIEADQVTSNAFTECATTNKTDKVQKKKKSNIFRKVTRLGKISEENIESKEAEKIAEQEKDKIPQGQDVSKTIKEQDEGMTVTTNTDTTTDKKDEPFKTDQ